MHRQLRSPTVATLRAAVAGLVTWLVPAMSRGQDTAPAHPSVRDTTADSAARARTCGYDCFYDQHPWVPRLVGAQFTFIGQDMPPFPAAYNGKNSLSSHGDHQATHTYGAYVGARLTPYLQVYVDGEMARGAGVSGAVGLAGLTDGDVIREGSVNLGQGPYWARAYARYLIPLSPDRDTADRGQDQLPVAEPTKRIEIKAGKWALSDDFDLNSYAGSTRTAFMDWGLWDNSAWDYAADTRGYTNGFLIGYVSPRWSFKIAAAQMPTFANGNTFDNDLAQAYGLNAELTLRPNTNGTVIRILGYQNRGRMGIYRDAIDTAIAHDTTPNIVADDRKGRVKYGFGLNAEQPLADSGNTGVFLRMGWNDGRTEDFVFTEADREISGGLQLAGNSWRRSDDRLGIAFLVDGLSEDHEAYLADGGIGFLLGDGRLKYNTENIAELYYRFEVPVVKFIQVAPAFQFIDHPGYNEARGPVEVYTIRVHMQY